MQLREREVLSGCRLFQGLNPDCLDGLLPLLDGQRRNYFQDELLLRPESAQGRVGILLDGRAHVLREEYSGARTASGGKTSTAEQRTVVCFTRESSERIQETTVRIQKT